MAQDDGRWCLPIAEIDHLADLVRFGWITRQRFRERAFGEQPWQARKAIDQIDREQE